MNINQAVQAHLDLTAKIKALQVEQKALGEAIKNEMAETGTKFFTGLGTDTGLQLVESVRWSLNQTLVKEEMGEDWFVAHSGQSLVQSLRLSREK